MTSPRTRTRPATRARRVGGLLLLLAVLAVAAGLATSLAGVDTRRPAAAVGPLAGAGPADAAPSGEGRRVFLRDCAWCHAEDGSGTRYGPSLAASGAAAADFYLRTGRMPLESAQARAEPGPPAYPDDTIDALVEHVAALGDGPAIPELAPGDPVAGRSLFLASCAPCHSSSGTGTVVSGGHDAPELFETGSTQVAEAIRLGPGAMPEFPESHIDDEELDDIVTYVEQLGEEQVVGGLGLDQYGPIAEGLFVWLVLMPVLLVVARLLGKRAKR